MRRSCSDHGFVGARERNERVAARFLLPARERKQAEHSQPPKCAALENSAQRFYMTQREDDLGHIGDSMRDGPVTYRRMKCVPCKIVSATP
ncbi:hypothetical protein AGRA671_15725 [Agrobacterium radiobacter]|jgi:hypothetical protein|nr:Uncharacterised protein [Agrobacterium tumefaciens]